MAGTTDRGEVWASLFAKYDADGSGELEIDEFTDLVRNEPGSIPP